MTAEETAAMLRGEDDATRWLLGPGRGLMPLWNVMAEPWNDPAYYKPPPHTGPSGFVEECLGCAYEIGFVEGLNK